MAPETRHQLRTYLNAFILFVPLGIVAGILNLPEQFVFWLNWLAIVPLAPITTMAVLKLSVNAGQIKGGLLKAILGNTTEMIICIIAMIKGYTWLAQSIIVGSVLSYSLLFLGGSYLVASIGKESISYNKKQTSVMSALMLVVCISLVIPTIVARASGPSYEGASNDTLFLSRGTAIVLLIFFATYLVFRFGTHTTAFAVGAAEDSQASRPVALERLVRRLGSRWELLYLLSGSCVVFCSMYMIGSLQTTAKGMHLNRRFVGVVLLPLAGNAGKSIVIISRARAGQIDKAIRLLMTNILDTMLFITPSVVILGWMIGLPMSLEFGLFQAIVLTLAIIVMAHLLQPGSATYFEGVMLMGTYVVIVSAFCFGY